MQAGTSILVQFTHVLTILLGKIVYFTLKLYFHYNVSDFKLVLYVHLHSNILYSINKTMYSVCHIAGEFIERLQQQVKDDQKLKQQVEITKQDVLCVKIAALCHDLGQLNLLAVFL